MFIRPKSIWLAYEYSETESYALTFDVVVAATVFIVYNKYNINVDVFITLYEILVYILYVEKRPLTLWHLFTTLIVYIH